jgi:hypothetical protein
MEAIREDKKVSIKENEETYRSMRIDVHSHMYPAEYVKGLAAAGIASGIGVGLPPWSVEKLFEVIAGNGHTGN